MSGKISENGATNIAYLESLLYSARVCKEIDGESEQDIKIFTKKVLKHD